MTEVVVDLGIRCHLLATLRACPAFRRLDKLTPDAPATSIRVHIPAFNVAHRTRVTILRGIAEARF
jgi:hypothetical protein